MRQLVPFLVLLATLLPAGCMSDPPAKPAATTPAPAKNQTLPPEVVIDTTVALRPDADPPAIPFTTTKNYTYLMVRVDITRASCTVVVGTGVFASSNKIRITHPSGSLDMNYYASNSVWPPCDGQPYTYLTGERQVITKPGAWTITTEGRGVGIKLGYRVTGFWDEPPKDPYAQRGK